MKTFGNKLVNHTGWQRFGEGLKHVVDTAGALHTAYTTARAVVPYLNTALRIGSALI